MRRSDEVPLQGIFDQHRIDFVGRLGRVASALPETQPMLLSNNPREDIGARPLGRCVVSRVWGRGIRGCVRAQSNCFAHHVIPPKQLFPRPHLGASDCLGGVPCRVDGSLLPQTGAHAEATGFQS